MSHSNGHDVFVRDVISEKKYAIEILKASLPGDVVKVIKWPSLKLEEDSFVDENMKEFQSDALFSAVTKTFGNYM